MTVVPDGNPSELDLREHPPMHPTLGSRLTAALASAGHDATSCHRFGELPVPSALHVGDGGTFHCHVQREVAPGTWGVPV
jgi:hypothetical protein